MLFSKKIFIFILLLILFISKINATVYENAEDGQTKKWRVLQSFSEGSVSNFYDEEKKSNVIKLEGSGTKSAYMLMKKKAPSWKNRKETVLHWELKYEEDFIIIVALETQQGKRFLIYTTGDKDSYLQYGLSKEVVKGKWMKYSRNLQEDLQKFDPYNRIVSVNNFVIKGSGLLDNISLTKVKTTLIKKEIVKIEAELTPKVAVPDYKKILMKKKTLDTPIITIIGDNPLVLKKGEKYVEFGAVAIDKNNEEIIVNSSHSIDIFLEGEYSVLYMATDDYGNSVIDKRRVRVGNVSEEKSKVSTVPVIVKEESEDEVEDFGNRETEMLAWEKELLLREEEIAHRESRPNPSPYSLSHPSRPGL